MHLQPDLYSPALGRQFHRQGRLFDEAAALDADSDLTCGQCGRLMVRTDGFYCCPNGHGKLIEAEPWGRWFDDTEGE